MTRPGLPVVLLCAALVVTACTRTSDGAATGGGERSAAKELPDSSESTGTWGTSPTRATETAPSDPGEDFQPGVVPTAQESAPAGSVCAPMVPPAVSTLAEVSDPLAPTATVSVPEGWSMSSGGGDPVGARLQGPDMGATVTINRTSLDPAAAFREYTDNLTDGYSISTVSTLPAPMCGYSGQRLIGVLSDGEETVEYEDRVVHVPASGQHFLIAIHVETPSEASGFDEAASQLTEDFEIGLP